MNRLTLKEQEQMTETKPTKNIEMRKFFRMLGNSTVRSVLDSLRERPHNYSYLLNANGYTKVNGGKFAYHLRKIIAFGLIQKNTKTREYFLTFKGLKMCEVMESADRVANLDINSIDVVNQNTYVILEATKTWLEPILRTEIRKVIRSLQDKTPQTSNEVQKQ